MLQSVNNYMSRYQKSICFINMSTENYYSSVIDRILVSRQITAV